MVLAAGRRAGPPTRTGRNFAGPAALGIADNPDLPDTWSATENVAWKHDIPGRGWSSPIVWGHRVFVTTVTSDEALKDKDRKRGLYLGGNRRTSRRKRVHQWHVLCLDLGDGKSAVGTHAAPGRAPRVGRI